jgi:hypothetical protein
MTDSFLAANGLLSAGLQAAVSGDTLVLVQSRDALDLVYGVAAGTFVLLLLALLLVVLGVLAQTRKAVRSLERTADEIRRSEGVARIGRTLGHLEAVAATVQKETEHLSASVARVGDQVTLASRRMEERIEEFNALLAVVQEEAEEVFLDTASTARGVRRGIGALGHGGGRDGRAARRAARRAAADQITPPAASPQVSAPMAQDPAPSGGTVPLSAPAPPSTPTPGAVRGSPWPPADGPPGADPAPTGAPDPTTPAPPSQHPPLVPDPEAPR